MFLFLFLLLFVICFAVLLYFLRPTKTETAVQRHLEEIQDTIAEDTGQTILKDEGYSQQPDLARFVRQIPGSDHTLKLIQQAGRKWTVTSVMGVSVLSFVVAAWIVSLFVPRVSLSLLAGVIAASIPFVVLLLVREQRFRKCDQLLPHAVDLMARGLRAGHSLTAVLEMVSNEVGEPISSEFKHLHEEHALGLSLREATLNLVNRLPRDDVRFLATAIILQKETGANLAVILDKTAVVARERARLRGQIRIYTAQGRITGLVLCLMPFIMFTLLSSVNWPVEKLLFTEHTGQVLIYLGFGLMVTGILIIRKIVDVKV